ncbi:lysozyme inhibitor LprI family protein [Rhodanobacter sp. DHG33]|uniref:lysozyme inhibitor LprI family protein n=1 Tax=Rhodanobacter sp. DHG33 TaxID=2775921 RepID=UPI00177B837C|nr:lysozyme inhibitor LprI family protein [Rhodanobacter sp. DHG33]MBD8897551.1 hypothetical protein [Rhodanobacter sp. DHG33]
MRSIGMKVSLALALLGAAPLAWAAGFDCAKAGSAAERQICGNAEWSGLDGQMTQAFAQARTKAGTQADALLRDQRNWLGERNDAVLQAAQLKTTRYATDLYRERIAFLEHVFDAPPTDAPLLAAIVKHLAGQPSAPSQAEALGGDGSVFKLAKEQPYDPSKPLPFDTAPLAKLGDDAGIEMPSALTVGPKLLRLDELHLGALYSVAGTADCVTMALFSWQGRAVQPVPVPETLSQNCWTTQGWLVEFQNRAYALQSDDSSIAASDIETQQWDGSRWGAPARALVRYDYRTSPQYVQCAQADCAGLSALAGKVLDRYVRSRDADALAGHVPADAQAQFETLRQRAGKEDGLKELPWADAPKSYTHPGDGYTGYRGFDDGSVFFPIRWQGEWLLGRIGHAALGWRSSDDWLLGLWRWDGHAFVPVFGMVAPTRREGFLLAARLPAKPFQSH